MLSPENSPTAAYDTFHIQAYTFQGTALKQGWMMNPQGQPDPPQLLLCARLHNVEVGNRFHNLLPYWDWEPRCILKELAPIKPL